MAAWRARVAAHSAVASYVHLIVNEGAAAGASLEHSHAQLYALPFVPAEVARERERFNAYHERTLGSHLLEDVIVEEVRRRERLVAFDGEAVLFCPWASRSPFELRLAPRSPAPRFEAGRARRGDARDRARGARRRLRLAAAAQPLGAHRAARDRGVPLAHRSRARGSSPVRASSSAPESRSTVYPPEAAAAGAARGDRRGERRRRVGCRADGTDRPTLPALHGRHRPAVPSLWRLGGAPRRCFRVGEQGRSRDEAGAPLDP